MKNLFRVPFAMLIASIIFVGCTKEEPNPEIVEQDNLNNYVTFSMSEFDEIKSEYEALLMSQPFIDLRENINSINSNLPQDIEITFTSDDEFYAWLESNIESTSFDSFEAAQLAYENSQNQYLTILENNSELYHSILALEQEEQENIFKLKGQFIIIEPNPEPTPDTCFNECINDANACREAANRDFAASTAGSATLWATGIGAIPGMVAEAIASLQCSAAKRACVRTLNACVAGCD